VQHTGRTGNTRPGHNRSEYTIKPAIRYGRVFMASSRAGTPAPGSARPDGMPAVPRHYNPTIEIRPDARPSRHWPGPIRL